MARAVDAEILTAILSANGWAFERQNGTSHGQWKKGPGFPTLTIAPNSRGEIPIGTAKSIVNAAGEDAQHAFRDIVQKGGGGKALKAYIKEKRQQSVFNPE